jgi:hypothetical protein
MEFITEPERWAEVNADGCPYNPSTPEARVWRQAQTNGKAAASWVFDGNTTRETYARMLKGIDDGDPEVMDSVRTPSLSGEYGDDYSEDDLMSDVGWVPNDGTDMRSDLAEQYNVEVSAAFWHEVERMARDQVESQHADYPHEPGRLYDCWACEAICHCVPNATQCVYSGDHNGEADKTP